MFLSYLFGGAPWAASSPSRSGQTQQHVSLLRLFSGYAFDPSCLLFGAYPWHLFFLDVGSLRVKGGCLSITTQGSYRLSSPHPLALSTASRPGKPAMAETRSRVGTRGRRASTSNQACALKGGYLSITTQGSYRLSIPHPLALPTASRPGKPAMAETSSRAETRGRRESASGQICRNRSQVKAQCQAQSALR